MQFTYGYTLLMHSALGNMLPRKAQNIFSCFWCPLTFAFADALSFCMLVIELIKSPHVGLQLFHRFFFRQETS